jgi:hypothetical protein
MGFYNGSTNAAVLRSQEGNMSDECKEKRSQGGGAAGATGGVLWFAGWLFTIGFVNLAWWKVMLGLVVWPYFLGVDLK